VAAAKASINWRLNHDTKFALSIGMQIEFSAIRRSFVSADSAEYQQYSHSADEN
jgi:hypothetical protein